MFYLHAEDPFRSPSVGSRRRFPFTSNKLFYSARLAFTFAADSGETIHGICSIDIDTIIDHSVSPAPSGGTIDIVFPATSDGILDPAPIQRVTVVALMVLAIHPK
jgi:hypothetical protein